MVVVLGVGSADTTEPLRTQQWGATGRDKVATRGPVPTDPVPSPMSSSTSERLRQPLISLARSRCATPPTSSHDVPPHSILAMVWQYRGRKRRAPFVSFVSTADRPTGAPLDGRSLPPYSPPLDTECDWTRMGRFATESHTLAALGILERPILCKHLRLRDGGLPRHPSWHLGAS